MIPSEKRPKCQLRDNINILFSEKTFIPLRFINFHISLPIFLTLDNKGNITIYSFSRNSPKSALKLESHFIIPQLSSLDSIRDIQFFDFATTSFLYSKSQIKQQNIHKLSIDQLGASQILILTQNYLLLYDYMLEKCYKSQVDHPAQQSKLIFTKLKVIDSQYIAVGRNDGIIAIFSVLQLRVIRFVNQSRSIHNKAINKLELVYSSQFSKKRACLLTASVDGSLALWSLDQIRGGVKQADPAPVSLFHPPHSANAKAHEGATIQDISTNSDESVMMTIDDEKVVVLWSLKQKQRQGSTGAQIVRIKQIKAEKISINRMKFMNIQGQLNNCFIGHSTGKKNEGVVYLVSVNNQSGSKSNYEITEMFDLNTLCQEQVQQHSSSNQQSDKKQSKLKILDIQQHQLFPDLWLILGVNIVNNQSILICLEMKSGQQIKSISSNHYLHSKLYLSYEKNCLLLKRREQNKNSLSNKVQFKSVQIDRCQLGENISFFKGDPVSLKMHGQFIALNNNQKGFFSIYRVVEGYPIDAQKKMKVKNIISKQIGYDFNWSPDGKKFVVIAYTNDSGTVQAPPPSSSSSSSSNTTSGGKKSSKGQKTAIIKPLQLSLLIYDFDQINSKLRYQYNDFSDNKRPSYEFDCPYSNSKIKSLMTTPFPSPNNIVWSESKTQLCAVIYRSHFKVYSLSNEDNQFNWLITYKYPKNTIIYSLIFDEQFIYCGTSQGIYFHSPTITGIASNPLKISNLLKQPLQIVEFSDEDLYNSSLPLNPIGFYQLLFRDDDQITLINRDNEIQEVAINKIEVLIIIELKYCSDCLANNANQLYEKRIALLSEWMQTQSQMQILLPYLVYYNINCYQIRPSKVLELLCEERLSKGLMKRADQILLQYLNPSNALQAGEMKVIIKSKNQLRLLMWEILRRKKMKHISYDVLVDLDLIGQMRQYIQRENSGMEISFEKELIFFDAYII